MRYGLLGMQKGCHKNEEYQKLRDCDHEGRCCDYHRHHKKTQKKKADVAEDVKQSLLKL